MTTHPLPHDVAFVAHQHGKVHVAVTDLDDEPNDPIATITGRTPTRCGRHISRNLTGAGFITNFDDQRLCGACHRTVPADEQHRLFEHPQAVADQ